MQERKKIVAREDSTVHEIDGTDTYECMHAYKVSNHR